MTESFEEVPGETSQERGVRKAILGHKSEFGEGVLIPLLYWSKHFMSDQCGRAHHVDQWIKMGMPPVTSMRGKYDNSFVSDIEMFVNVELMVAAKHPEPGTKHTPEELALSRVIEMQFYTAADHLFGLKTCPKFSDELNAKIEKLRDTGLTNRMFRMNAGGKILTIEDLNQVWELTKEIALEIDQQVLGIEDADPGEYD